MFTDKKNRHSNKYGYQVDITKPKYRELYERYKKYKNIPEWCPLSDAERLEFEDYVLGRKGKKNERRTY